jgi:hypothetical protein
MNFATATQDAIYAKLDAATAVTALAPVMQHVPENADPPLVIIGSVALTPVGGKDGNFDRAEVEVITIYRGPKRAAMFAIQSAVQDTLDNQELTGDALFSRPRQVSNDDELLEDGITYLGTQRFELFVQPL